MADPARSSGSGAGSDEDSASGLPGWVKTVGIVVIIIVLLFAAMMLAGGGHTPPPGAHG